MKTPIEQNTSSITQTVAPRALTGTAGKSRPHIVAARAARAARRANH